MQASVNDGKNLEFWWEHNLSRLFVTLCISWNYEWKWIKIYEPICYIILNKRKYGFQWNITWWIMSTNWYTNKINIDISIELIEMLSKLWMYD